MNKSQAKEVKAQVDKRYQNYLDTYEDSEHFQLTGAIQFKMTAQEWTGLRPHYPTVVHGRAPFRAYHQTPAAVVAAGESVEPPK